MGRGVGVKRGRTGSRRAGPGRGKAWPGRTRARVRLGRGRETDPTGGVRLAVRQRGEGAMGRIGPGGGERSGGDEFLGRGVKEKKRVGPVWAESEGEREKPFHFLKRFKLFYFKFKHKD